MRPSSQPQEGHFEESLHDKVFEDFMALDKGNMHLCCTAYKARNIAGSARKQKLIPPIFPAAEMVKCPSNQSVRKGICVCITR